MKKIGKYIAKHKILILIITLILLIPAFIGMQKTKINYNILLYLPSDNETVEGQNTLTNDFNLGAFSMTVIENMNPNDIINLENKIRKIDGVNTVLTIYDAVGTTVPLEMLPNNLADKVKNGDADLMLITYNNSTSDEQTLSAVEEVKNITGDSVKVGGMSSMVLDTMNLSEKEITIYIIIAVILCIVVLSITLDSYIVPFILLINIGIAILFNMGTNFFLGDISYITKAITAVLQLGVTIDFSIFLYHSYQGYKEKIPDREEAMGAAINDTFISVLGSALTTIAGFLVLCAMQLTIGKDLGIVMAKGVLFGVICVLTIFPSLLLFFDKLIEKTKHKIIFPKFNKVSDFIIKNYQKIFIVFLLLLIPAYIGYHNVNVYYKMDNSLPDDLESISANNDIKEKFNITSPELLLVNKNIKNSNMKQMINEIESVDGIEYVMGLSRLNEVGLSKDALSDELINTFENDEYQLLLINSNYEVASNELNNQVDEVKDIIYKYDENAVLAGEGPLTKDLVDISSHDFNNVNYWSMATIFIIMFFILKSLSLPILLISVIEFGIMVNLAIPYYMGTVLPFVGPIVIGTVQLGATIDYAILMTNNYLSLRKTNKDKKVAMRKTLDKCIGSIVISASCFFGATIGVGIYSDLEMVASLCTLISRGALISMIAVIFVLPSILLIFDKLIIKTTMGFKKEGKKMKKSKMLGLSLVLLTMLNINSVNALTKTETVYSKLDYYGNVKSTTVSEYIANYEKNDTIDDYSNLINIVNVNDNKEYSLSGNKLKWEADEKDVYYQGTTNEELPVSLKISYKLNNKDIGLEDLIGQSGKVTITLKYTNNDKHNTVINGKNEVIYTPFVIVAGTIINAENNSNITINNGKLISNGNNYLVCGLVTPGLYESIGLKSLKGMDNITINMETEKFELNSIYSIVIPKIISSSDLSFLDNIDSLTENVAQLQDYADKLTEGTKEVNNGVTKIKTEVTNSLKELKKTDTSNLLDEDTLNKIEATAKKESTLTSSQKEEIASEAESAVLASMDFDEIEKEAEAEVIKSTEYKALETAYNLHHKAAEDARKKLLLITAAAEDEKAAYYQSAMLLMKETVKQVASATAKEVAKEVAREVSVSVAQEVATETASQTSVKVAKEVANGVGTTMINEVIKQMSSLTTGLDQLSSGTNELATGMDQFNEQGVKEITNLFDGDYKTYEERIKKLVKYGEDYNTFTMKAKNTKGTTRFIMMTDSYKVEEVKEEEKPVEQTNLWTKIKTLFTFKKI